MMPMAKEMSANAKAILLLTAPLIVGRSKSSVRPLDLSEYRQLADRLREHDREPADLLEHGACDVLSESQLGLDSERVSQLLERGFLLSQALERWQARAIWVISRADAGYPDQFKRRLGRNAPPVLYGCGDADLLDGGGLSVVGSRNAATELLEYAENIGQLAAAAQCTVVSGEARGVDQAAIQGALTEGGRAIGVLSNSLESAALARKNRDALLDGRLVLISPYDPRAGFNVGHAMQRNKLVYALADAGLVVESEFNKGGTWTGAVEQLERLRYVHIFVRSNGKVSKGIEALRQKGASVWPNPQTPSEFMQAVAKDPSQLRMDAPRQATLLPATETSSQSFEERLQVDSSPMSLMADSADNPDLSPCDKLLLEVEELLAAMPSPLTESGIADELQVLKKQAREWLNQLARKGKYKRLTKPVRYERIPSSNS